MCVFLKRLSTFLQKSYLPIFYTVHEVIGAQPQSEKFLCGILSMSFLCPLSQKITSRSISSPLSSCSLITVLSLPSLPALRGNLRGQGRMAKSLPSTFSRMCLVLVHPYQFCPFPKPLCVAIDEWQSAFPPQALRDPADFRPEHRRTASFSFCPSALSTVLARGGVQMER